MVAATTAGYAFAAKGKRSRLESLRGQLENERASFLSHWRELGEHILPRRPRFEVTDANRGERRTQKILDTTPTLAARTLASGMMAGVTSPARPWFRLTTPDPGFAELASVKLWLDIVTRRMATIFLRSNLYNSLPQFYGDLGTFATSAMLVEEDFDDVIRTYVFPIGSYMIANSDRGKVEVFMREFRMMVRQVVEKFGREDGPGSDIDWSRISLHVRGLWEAGQHEAWIDVVHAIVPNDDYDPGSADPDRMRYLSCYYERGVSGERKSRYLTEADDDRFLRRSGYDYFPVLTPRWEVTGGDVYGTNSPGMTALGDIKQLQVGERRALEAIEKMVKPPMSAPSHLKTQKVSALPGDITYLDVRGDQQGVKPIYQVDPKIGELDAKQDQVRFRIRRAFYEDLFLMLATLDRRQITAREIDERHEEKLLALGPVLEQLNQDLLDPLIDIVFAIMLRQGLVPSPPEELQGVELRVEYISIMAQAQKLVGLSGIERLAAFVGQLAALSPQVLDKLDADQVVDEYADVTGVPPAIVRPDDAVAEIREARARVAAAQAQLAAIQQAAGAAKDLGQAKVTDDSALGQLARAAGAGQIAR